MPLRPATSEPASRPDAAPLAEPLGPSARSRLGEGLSRLLVLLRHPSALGAHCGSIAGPVAAVLLGVSGCSTVPTGDRRVGAPIAAASIDARRGPPPMSQLDHPTVRLGTGRFTISESGCFLTSLAMASAWLHDRSDLDPVRANDLVKARGGFRGSALDLPSAAPALGLRVVSRDVTRTPSTELLGRLRTALESGRPVIAAIDLGPGRTSGESDADHFILIHQQLGPEHWRALDPAGGVQLELALDPATGALRYRGAPERALTELIFLDRAPFPGGPS